MAVFVSHSESVLIYEGDIMTVSIVEDLLQLTPMVRQVYELKAQVPDAILFFRMGDFYEIFGDDAEKVAPILDLVLTSRERGDKTRLPFCGVPHHSARTYWLKLLKLGFRVAIADQLEDPASAKGLVKRGIVQILTPGCIDDLEGIEADQANHMIGVYEEPRTRKWVLAVLETSTGDFRLGSIEKEELLEWVERLAPRECVTRRFMQEEVRGLLEPYTHSRQLSYGLLPEAILRDGETQAQLLRQQFAVGDLDALPCGSLAGGLELVAAMLQYLESLHASTRQFLTIKPLSEGDRMLLDETVRRDLELFETSRRREVEGSLFREINATRTPMGARLLRHDLGQPFLKGERIAARQGAIAELLRLPPEDLQGLQDSLRKCGDLERLMTRVLARKAQPCDVLSIRRSLLASLELRESLNSFAKNGNQILGALSEAFARAEQPLAILQLALAEDVALLGSLDVFCAGYDSDFDSLRELSRHGEQKISAYEEQLRLATGISSLKIKEHKTYGLLIEVTKANLGKIPTSFIRRQTMVNNERFSTVELEELGETLASAMEKAVAREAELFADLLVQLGHGLADMKAVSEAIAQLDLIQSLAVQARKLNWVRPELAKRGELHLKACRHPVVERWVGSHQFMPNDVHLSEKNKQMLITGPNMAGKSTVMRQTALAAILHQIGSYVPASAAVMPIFDQIFTRVGAADDLSRGQSTFMVEMIEAATILRQASSKSLVILDEVGRGTSTQDGLAIAAAILRHISEDIGCYTLFATHYHELVPYSAELSGVTIAQVEVAEDSSGIRFTHRLIPGACASSFGVEVAKLAGIPEPVIEAAKFYLQKPEVFADKAAVLSMPQHEAKTRATDARQPPLEAAFDPTLSLSPAPLPAPVHSIVERLDRLNVLKTTPMQALAILEELKGYLHRSQQGSLFPEAPHLC